MKKIITLLTLTFALGANAQEVKSLTLKEAINYALENKAEAKKAKLQVENSEYQIQEVRSQALPQISANGNLTYNPIIQTTVIDGAGFGAPGTTIQAAFGQKWVSTAGVSLTQAIFDQTVFTGLKAAKSTREFYQINEQLTEEQVIERVANNYYQVYVQRQKLTVIDSMYKNTTKVKDIIKGQYDNGLAKKIDLDRTLVRISNINTQRQQVLNAVQIQENALKFYMGMPIETQIEIPQTAFEVSPQSLSEVPNTANRTEYLLLKKQEQLLFYQKKAVEAGYYPTLSLNAGYNYIGQGPKMPIGGKPSDGVYWSDFSSIGLNLKVPIFTGFSTRSKVRQADIDLRTIKEDINDTKLSLDLAFANAKTQIDNSLTTINNQRENAQLAKEVLDNTRNNYVQGLASLTDLLDAENSLTEAQNNYTSAILDYKLAEIQLIKSKGELKTLINN
ncbi:MULTISPECIES: TolC family protein [unclassified Flavobacterium]|jgi:outer membrane protein TolC|uniref:TolC family protein n=1 Tax=unclassified Flavobacterium TaxID=196869 RepID=UPI000C19B898|nr:MULTISPECIES: TolC family protein [unclassified Flavobacterium]PIF61087.1 outer membrane protein TolC [Flavobacterium sp. 11]RKS12923.1 outer membrane protein TolC [Flavobacterium sp. 120]WKL45465.1 TolC family protein [Flavobacterium sp. ZE23DGlu08]